MALRIETHPQGSQYMPLGGIPSIVPDVPINVVFLLLFLAAAAGHGFVLYRTLFNGRSFPCSILIAVFCLSRVIVTSLRMAWACHPAEMRLDAAILSFLYAGVILLYVTNLIFSQRLVRAQHPHFGWSRPVSIAFSVVYAVLATSTICLIGGSIASFYVRTPRAADATRQVGMFGTTILAIAATLPLLVVGSSTIARCHRHIRMTKTIDKFGEGTMRGKVAIVLASSGFLSISAWYQAAAVLSNPVRIQAPQPGYLSKACFYVLVFTIELAVCILWLFTSVHRRFHIPDRARGPFSYGDGFVFAGEPGNEKRPVSVVIDPMQETAQPPRSSAEVPVSPRSRRSSWAVSISSKEKSAQLEKRASWGGISRNDVQDTTDEEGKVLRYQPFAHDWVGGDTAADVGVEGPENELGFDAASGKWIVRPITPVSRPRTADTSA